jgi:hypothetical protein
VDASGRGSQTPQWLESLGYSRPEESTVKVSLGYATRIYRRPHNLPDWKALYVVPRPPTKRGGIIFPIEGDRWMVTLFGWLGVYRTCLGKGNIGSWFSYRNSDYGVTLYLDRQELPD